MWAHRVRRAAPKRADQHITAAYARLLTDELGGRIEAVLRS
jgi:hypothetical protein